MDRDKRLMLMDRALLLVRDNPSISQAAVAEALGLSSNAVKNWRAKNVDGYRDRYEAVLHEAFDDLHGDAIACMGTLIKQGNFQAAKYVLDNKGYKAEDKLKAEVTGNTDIKVTIGE